MDGDTSSTAYKVGVVVGTVAAAAIPASAPARIAATADRAATTAVTTEGVTRATNTAIAAADRSVATQVSTQRQARHVLGTKEYAGGGYFRESADAQRVLDAYHSGEATVLSVASNGNVRLMFRGVTGFNNNPRMGYLDQPTNVFMIKGSKSVSVVPISPRG